MAWLTKTLRDSAATISFISVLVVGSFCQPSNRQLPPDVVNKKGSLLGVSTTPPGATIRVDGNPMPSNPMVLLKKENPRVLRFELAGYKPLEKVLNPGNYNFIAVEVNFITQVVNVAELNELPQPGSPAHGSQTAATDGPAAAPPGSTAPAAAPATTQQVGPAIHPFGFDYGMTKEQVIAKLGPAAVVKDSGVNVVFNTAPNAHPDFESYILAFAPEAGLLKIRAISKTYQTSDDGTELRQRFTTFHDALAEKYGPAEKDLNFCKGNEVDCRSEYFMMTLLEKNRYLNSYWSPGKNTMPKNVQNIAIDAIALGINKGYVEISYEFDGWEKFVNEINRKRNSSF